ncbi:MAG: TlpA disulfide reductase family protein [Terracidiphilus sp.]
MFWNSASTFKRFSVTAFLLLALVATLHAIAAPNSDVAKPGEPTDPKARKTYASAINWEKHHNDDAAIDDFRKANKQDGGHCKKCLIRAYQLARQIGALKDEEQIAREMLPQAGTDVEKASVHYLLALALQDQGINSKKDKCFSESCEELKATIALEPQLALAHYANGVSLAHLHQDDAARAEFAAFLDKDEQNPRLHERAQRYKERIELAWAKMAPAFSLTTLDSQHISMDGMAGKVVLIDFWATWCGPCREALPHIRQIARKFNGQPLVVLSISLDDDEAKWKDFVGKNEMTWMQYRDGGFDSRIAKQFNVTAIPATFTIDADGVLEDQHMGDANIEGKLKKLIAQAVEVANRKPAPAADKSTISDKSASNTD